MISASPDPRPAGEPGRKRGRPARAGARAPEPQVDVRDVAALAALLEDEEIRGRAVKLSQSPDFCAKWKDWLDYRVEGAMPNTVRALRGQLKELAMMQPNPDEAWHAMDWAMTRGWEFPYCKPLKLPRQPLQAMRAALAKANVALQPGARQPTAADLSALADYKEQAVNMTPEERAALLKKCSDTLPHLSGSLAARIAMLNEEDRKKRR